MNAERCPRRLAIITTHPVQYYAPWFRWIAAHAAIRLRVFYLWDPTATTFFDEGFGQAVQWDLPLLSGYESEFVPNASGKPGSNRFFGINNPDLLKRLKSWAPHAALLIGYRYASMMRLVFTPKLLRRFPLIFRGDSHRLVPEVGSLKAEGRRFVINQIYRRFAALLYVGQANREYFRMHGVPDEKLFFAPHAVDNKRFMENSESARAEGMRWRAEIGVPDDHLLLMFAGKFEPKKRPVDLLEAFTRLGRSDVSLLFVGSGVLEQELRQQAARQPNVFFAPFQNQTEMPRTYAACDLFVLPSYGPEESWGLAINEALCLARPVIVSSHVGCAPDLVHEARNGWVFPAGDTDAFTETLRTALSEPDRLKRMGEEGRLIVNDYDYAAATAGLESALAAVTEHSTTR